MYVLC